MRCSFLWVGLSTAFSLGCAHDMGLVPAEAANRVPGNKSAALETAGGVGMVVNGNAWKGSPVDLEEVMTPVQVTIRNNSGRPLRIQYKDFVLVGDSGVRYEAMPPLSIERPATSRSAPLAVVPTFDPTFYHDRFFVSPFYHPFYPKLPPWTQGFPYDPVYHDRTFVSWRESLPTEDMLEVALPEGVVENGGTVSGFLFFGDVSPREKSVIFKAELVEGRDGKDMAAVEIPFRVQ